MPVHLVKMAVGVDSLEDLQAYQQRSAKPRAEDGRAICRHRTRHLPKRTEDLLDGGSLYWVIKGYIAARQAIVGFEPLEIEGQTHCLIQMDPDVVPVMPVPRRPHQGWRYLEEADAPADVGGSGAAASELAELPPVLVRELRALCLL